MNHTLIPNVSRTKWHGLAVAIYQVPTFNKNTICHSKMFLFRSTFHILTKTSFDPSKTFETTIKCLVIRCITEIKCLVPYSSGALPNEAIFWGKCSFTMLNGSDLQHTAYAQKYTYVYMLLVSFSNKHPRVVFKVSGRRAKWSSRYSTHP